MRRGANLSFSEPIKKGNKNKRNYGYDYYALCWLAGNKRNKNATQAPALSYCIERQSYKKREKTVTS